MKGIGIHKYTIGDMITLKDYNGYPDIKRHVHQTARIIDIDEYKGMEYTIKWMNGDTSCVGEDNIIPSIHPSTCKLTELLTPQLLEDMASYSFFSSGVYYIDGKMANWIAIRGLIADWAIYYTYHEGVSYEFISAHGAKLHDEDIIQLLVTCTEGALEMYRH